MAASLEIVRRVTLHGRVVADAATLDAATAGATGADLLVSVGSGTIADIGKTLAIDARKGRCARCGRYTRVYGFRRRAS